MMSRESKEFIVSKIPSQTRRETKWVRPRATEHCIKEVFGCITRVWSRHLCQADAAFRESVACSRIYLWS